MKFFFRITDINIVAERFDYLGPPLLPPAPVEKEKNEKAVEKIKIREKEEAKVDEKEKEKEKREDREKAVAVKEVKEKPIKCVRFTIPEKKAPKKVKEPDPKEIKNRIEKQADPVVCLEKEIAEEIKNRIQKEPLSEKSSVYTNITLNRSNNVEIITKIQKVSNKNGQPIGLNIIKQTVKKTKPVEVKKEEEAKKEANEVKEEVVEEKKETVEAKQAEKEEDEAILPAPVPMEVDLEKSNFLKSIELTAKVPLPAVSPRKVAALDPPKPAQKRKNPSPTKSEPRAKKPKGIKSKTIQNPAVRQIVSNVNQSATNVTKIVERNAPNKDLQSLFDSCKINIPSSLSITLKESSESDAEMRTPVPVKPVQNYIEILRLPDGGGGEKKKDGEAGDVKPTFQKMFEETIKKSDVNQKALDLTSEGTNKRNLAEVAQRLAKKAKQEEKNGKVAIPRLKVPQVSPKQQTVNCHSTSLGMNYKVSVGKAEKETSKVSTVSPTKSVVPKATSSVSVTTNQLLEKYNIQNLAQLTASFNFNATMNPQLAALQQAMILKHFEMQNRQNWLNMNPSPLVQYEKYLKSLQGQSVGKEN